MSTPDAVDQTTYGQQQIPGVDWEQYSQREIPTDAEIFLSLPGDAYYEHLSQTLWQQFDVNVTPGQLKLGEAYARKSYYYDQLRQAQAAHPAGANA